MQAKRSPCSPATSSGPSEATSSYPVAVQRLRPCRVRHHQWLRLPYRVSHLGALTLAVHISTAVDDPKC